MIERMPFLLNLRFQLQRLQWLTASLIAGLAAAAVIAATAGVQVAHAQMRSGGVDHLPALGEASVDELSPAAEQRLGDQIYQEFLRAGVIHDDPEVTDYLTKQASRLLDAATLLGHSEAGRPFQFFVVKDPTLNAFALPGGYIGVHTGLITASPRESEIMSVLAHEIGHVTQRHIARMFGQQRQSSAVMIAAALLAALAAQASPDAAMGVLSLGQTMAIREQLAFSRDAEREADRVGLQILAASGFDPHGMSSMFERLGQAGRLYDNNAPAYLRTHPLSSERVADMQNRLQTDPQLRLSGRGGAGGPQSIEFGWHRAKLMALADTRVDGLRNSRLLFEQALKDPANATPGHRAPLYFGLAWAAILQRDFPSAQSHIALAQQEAQQAGVLSEVAPLLMHQQLRLAIALNDAAMSEKLLAEAKSFAHVRAVTRAMIEAQLNFAMPAEPIVTLARNATQKWPQDPQVWALLGRAEAARGHKAAQHAAFAEQYALAGAYAAAVDQLTLARKAGDADFMTLSKIDARLTVMRAALRREQLERQQQQR